MKTRFEDQGRYESEFLSEFLVRCPRCQRRAYVRSDGVPWTVKQAKLTCTACGHSDSWCSGEPKGNARGTARRRCPYCARWLEKRLTGSPSPREADLHCTACRIVVREPVSWMRIPGSLTLDPFFGCPLWFVGDVKGHVFWAYNPAHLNLIRNYVAATLRIRQPYRNRSVVSRLPAFLLARKNRAAVLKEIDRIAGA